jgi:hypothetical protein
VGALPWCWTRILCVPSCLHALQLCSRSSTARQWVAEGSIAVGPFAAVMAGDTEPIEILLHLPLLAEDKVCISCISASDLLFIRTALFILRHAMARHNSL